MERSSSVGDAHGYGFNGLAAHVIAGQAVESGAFCMPGFLRRCLTEELTGTLRVTGGANPSPIIKTVSIDRGAIRFASSSWRAERTPDRIVASGRITREEFERAGFQERFEYKVAEIVADLFTWGEAETHFDAGKLSEAQSLANVSIPAVLVMGMLRVEDRARVERLFGDIDEVLVQSQKALDILRSIPLEPEEALLVSCLERPTRPRDLIEDGSVDPEVALRILCGLRLGGVLEAAPARPAVVPVAESPVKAAPKAAPKAAAEAAAKATPEAAAKAAAPAPAASDERSAETTATRRSSAASTGHPAPLPVPPVDAKEAARICALIDEKIALLRDDADYYTILEVDRRARVDEIKAKYVELVKIFHPNRHAQLAPYNADVRRCLELIFATLAKAFSTLSKVESRAAYNIALERQEHRVAAAQSGRLTASAAAAPQAQQPTAPLATAPLTARLAPNASTAPLQVPVAAQRPAQPAQAPAAPARTMPLTSPRPVATAPPSDDRAYLRALASTVVAKEAERTLQEPSSSDADLRTTQTTWHSLPLTAAEWYMRGLEFAGAGDHDRAARAFQRAVEWAPRDAEMHAAFARSLAHLKGGQKQAERIMLKAVELAPRSSTILVELGCLYQKLGRPQEAQEVFERALGLSPTGIPIPADATVTVLSYD